MAKRMKRMDPSLNISADSNSHQPWSSVISSRIDTSGVKIGRELVNDINRHAQVVLDGIAALKEVQEPSFSPSADGNPQEEATMPGACVSIDDLRGAAVEKHQPLCIVDPSQYFSSSAPTSMNIPTIVGQREPVLRSLQAISPSDISLNPISPHAALRVLFECSRGSSAYLQGSMEDQGGYSAISPDTLAHELLQSFRKESLAVNELCRLYWQHSDHHGSGEVKRRILAEINKRYQLLNEQRKAATGPERIVVRNLLKPLIDMIDSIPSSVHSLN